MSPSTATSVGRFHAWLDMPSATHGIVLLGYAISPDAPASGEMGHDPSVLWFFTIFQYRGISLIHVIKQIRTKCLQRLLCVRLEG